MATETSSIDDLLMGGKTDSQPQAPEFIPDEPTEEIEVETEVEPEYESEEDVDEVKSIDKADNTDEYGNDKPSSKTYTEEEVNERINKAVRERVARMERNQGQQQQAQTQAPSGFEYNPDSAQDWQQQLQSFVEQTVSSMTQRQHQQQQAAREQQAQAEFEEKFYAGMGRFSDYVDVVGSQPVSDAMVVATRAMKDPAAFIYAASKRAPQELQRISQIPDQYVQMVEMGKLEERMRQTKPASKAPRPVARTIEDSGIPHKSDKVPSIEDLIARSERSKLAKLNLKRK